MRELPLTMKEYSGENTKLTSEQKDALKKIIDFASMVLELNRSGKGVPVDAAGYSSLMEADAIDYCKASNYVGELEKEAEERHRIIRALNFENRELRHQLGEKITSEDARERVKIMQRKLAEWWKNEFSGWVSDSTSYCTPYGYLATLHMSTRIHHAENREEIIARVKEFGIEIIDDTRDDDTYPLFSPSNVEKLLSFIRRRFPSADILDVKCRKYRCIPPGINEIEICIRDCDDFEKEKTADITKRGVK